MSSIQSVAGQPLAAPLSRPIHQAVLPSAATRSVSASNSSHVEGTLYPAATNALGLDQIRPFNAAFAKIPNTLPSTAPMTIQLCAYCVDIATNSNTAHNNTNCPTRAGSHVCSDPAR